MIVPSTELFTSTKQTGPLSFAISVTIIFGFCVILDVLSVVRVIVTKPGITCVSMATLVLVMLVAVGLSVP